MGEDSALIPAAPLVTVNWCSESSNDEDGVERKEEQPLSASETPPRSEKRSVNSKEPERKNTATAAGDV